MTFQQNSNANLCGAIFGLTSCYGLVRASQDYAKRLEGYERAQLGALGLVVENSLSDFLNNEHGIVVARACSLSPFHDALRQIMWDGCVRMMREYIRGAKQPTANELWAAMEPLLDLPDEDYIKLMREIKSEAAVKMESPRSNFGRLLIEALLGSLGQPDGDTATTTS